MAPSIGKTGGGALVESETKNFQDTSVKANLRIYRFLDLVITSDEFTN